jgi:hypothetical protein
MVLYRQFDDWSWSDLSWTVTACVASFRWAAFDVAKNLLLFTELELISFNTFLIVSEHARATLSTSNTIVTRATVLALPEAIKCGNITLGDRWKFYYLSLLHNRSIILCVCLTLSVVDTLAPNYEVTEWAVDLKCGNERILYITDFEIDFIAKSTIWIRKEGRIF